MNKYLVWRQMSIKLKALKAEEMKMRKELCIEIFDGQLGEATKKFEIDEGYTVHAKSGVSHKLDERLVNQMFNEFSEEDKNALKFKPSLKLREYKKLGDDSLLHEAVEVKPSAPTLKVELIK